MEITSPLATNLKYPLSAIVKTLVNHQIPVLATLGLTEASDTNAIFIRHLNRTVSAKVVTIITRAAGLQWLTHLMILLDTVDHFILKIIRVTQKTKVYL